MAYVSPGNAPASQIEAIDPTITQTVSAEPRLIIPKLNIDVPIRFDVPLDQVYRTLAQDYYNSMYNLRSDLLTFQSTSHLTDSDFSYFTLNDSDEILANLTEQMKEIGYEVKVDRGDAILKTSLSETEGKETK